jgi:ribosomal-protein-alanine N-acetyltransferase
VAPDNKITVSKATDRELYSIYVLSRAYFPYANFSYKEILARVEGGRVTYLVARMGGRLAGYLDYEVYEDHAKILGLAVLEEYRGNGIARKILRKALRDIKKTGYERAYLFVSKDNAIAQKLYADEGFSSAGLLEKKINGEDVLLFQKNF